MLVALQAPYRTTCSTGPVQHSDLHHNVTAAIRCTLTSRGEEAASTISLVETGPRTSAAVMENSPVEMAGLREGSWIVLGAWQGGAQSGYSGAGFHG
ncbi:UPF0753 protein [Dissostichus eleginoides]|uniref:UPF0753 protein n=1 Tax=Dissostichus eleginoides TaxID=100907 RepID=A0AAD9F7S3_DISEL|nr:UPF0753 protein [Dissostichus eleginoides]